MGIERYVFCALFLFLSGSRPFAKCLVLLSWASSVGSVYGWIFSQVRVRSLGVGRRN